jgi:hypothetical protein
MLNLTFKRSAATLAVVAGLLATAGPASAVLYNGHAGLGSSVYQHNQTDLEAAFSPQGPGLAGKLEEGFTKETGASLAARARRAR